ncbi:hypothetical protein D0962_22660 [Leptolyngbyaceae cyanobacterium CCMR0082]|uniref:Inorganic pyrophosphatase domain-containing protein n=1 Tax=Adonisia turfae CCMR0082 TaxID=2304604 RepID=A0A6M0SAQ0_9CYAN|nr:hypothetical protein [Adonisia turfae]NEZ65530.1 hypothetical protein [Adonisia turfae CCMR0082]
MTPKKLAELAIESIYNEPVDVQELTIGVPSDGWNAIFSASIEGKKKLLKSIFNGEELIYFDPETVDVSELRADELDFASQFTRTEDIKTDDATPTKRVLKWNGFEIGLQYLPFEKRHGRVLPAGYGHFRKTKGADGMAVDVYVGTQLTSPKIFVIDQFINGEFDEEKMVIGVERIEDAIAIYTAAMPREMMGGVREISLEQLREYKVGVETKADAAETFQPDPVAISDYADLNSLIEFNWDAVRDIAAEQGWIWDAEQGVYLADDEPAPYDLILEVTQAELERLEGEIEEATTLLIDGDATATEWEELIAETVVAAALLFCLLGFGRRPTTSQEADLQRELERQFKYLRNFTQDILTGTMTPAGIAARGKLYVHDAQLGYVLGQELAHPRAEFPYVRNRLGSCDHCRDCIAETGRGWVRRGDMSMPGTRLCRIRCCCGLEYGHEGKVRLDEVATMLGIRDGWL